MICESQGCQLGAWQATARVRFAIILANQPALLLVLPQVRDDKLFSILAELAGPRLHELKPYEACKVF